MNENRMREIRAARRTSQFDLRIKTGYSQSMISYWERGLLTPSDEQKARLASALGVKVNDLFPGAK